MSKYDDCDVYNEYDGYDDMERYYEDDIYEDPIGDDNDIYDDYDYSYEYDKDYSYDNDCNYVKHNEAPASQCLKINDDVVDEKSELFKDYIVNSMCEDGMNILEGMLIISKALTKLIQQGLNEDDFKKNSTESVEIAKQVLSDLKSTNTSLNLIECGLAMDLVIEKLIKKWMSEKNG